jgi:hypothetical protein
MRKSSQLLHGASAGHQATGAALANREDQLTEAELDQVAAAGGKTGASTNPIKD